MNVRTSVGTAAAATSAVLALGAAPADAVGTAHASAARHTTLSITASTTKATIGLGISLTAHLGPTAHNRVVEIDNGRTVVGKGRVDVHGNLTAFVTAIHNATYVARFAGDSKDRPATARVHVDTSANVVETIYHGTYSREGFWYVTGSTGVWAEVFISPKKAGETVHFHAQEEINGRWYNIELDHRAAKLNAQSYATRGYKQLPAGLTLRMAASWNGDTTNTAPSFRWLYVKTV